MSECYANIKCYLKEEETARDADYGKMPGTHPPHPEAKGTAETICRGSLSYPAGLLAEPVCVHAFAHVCTARVCTCDEQALLTSALGVFRGPLNLCV